MWLCQWHITQIWASHSIQYQQELRQLPHLHWSHFCLLQVFSPCLRNGETFLMEGQGMVRIWFCSCYPKGMILCENIITNCVSSPPFSTPFKKICKSNNPHSEFLKAFILQDISVSSCAFCLPPHLSHQPFARIVCPEKKQVWIAIKTERWPALCQIFLINN